CVEGGQPQGGGGPGDGGELRAVAAVRKRGLPVLRRVGAAGRCLFGAVDDQRADDDVAVRQVLRVDPLVGADAPAVLGDQERSTGASPPTGELGGRLRRRDDTGLGLVGTDQVRACYRADGEGGEARPEGNGYPPVAGVAG